MTALTPAPSPDLGGWFHNLTPYVLRISGDFGIRWYGVSYLAGFVLAYVLLRLLIRRGYVSVPLDRAADVIMALVLGTVVGGRLGYMLLYQPSLLWTFTSTPPWWGALAINQGGMASHGAILGLVLACLYLSRGFKNEHGDRVGATHPRRLLDALALFGAPGVALGRLANFINGELLGKIVAGPGEPAPWWSVRYPQEILTKHAQALTPAQETDLAILIESRALPNEPWEDTYARMLTAIHRGAPELQARLEPLISARHPSQLYQAFAEGVLTTAVVWGVARTSRRPGVAGCWFLIVYGVGRIATEFYRLPDDHLQTARILGFSRGQWLSALMVLLGVAILVWILRRPEPRLPGWGKNAGSGTADTDQAKSDKSAG